MKSFCIQNCSFKRANLLPCADEMLTTVRHCNNGKREIHTLARRLALEKRENQVFWNAKIHFCPMQTTLFHLSLENSFKILLKAVLFPDEEARQALRSS